MIEKLQNVAGKGLTGKERKISMLRAEQSRAEQSRAEQSRAEQSRAEQSRAEQSRAEQSRTISIILNSWANCPNGGIKVIYEYANYLAEKGHKVVLYIGQGNTLEKLPVPYWFRSLLVKFLIANRQPKWFKFNKNIKRRAIRSIIDAEIFDADIVIATLASTAKQVATLSKNKGKKYYFIQGFENWYMSTDEVYETYNLGMTNIVVANWLQRIVDEHSRKPSLLVSNAIDTNIFKMTNFKRKRHSIAYHYRSAKYKGWDYGVETINMLYKIYPDLKVYVVSIEGAPENLPECCEFLQNLLPIEVAEINNKSRVFMCSSIEEGFGLPGLEAMACGCALVSTEYQGVLEYGINNKNALLSPIKDSVAMVENVCKLFENDDLYNSIVQSGIETASARNINVAAEKFEKALLAD